MKNFSIRAKFISLILIILIPLSALYMGRIISIHSNNVNHELEANRQLVEAISTSFMGNIQEIWTEETTLNIFFDKNPELPQNDIKYYLNEALKNQNIADVFSWVSPEGVVIASTREDLIGQSIAERSFFQRVIDGEDEVVSDLVVGMASKKPVIPIVKAARRDGKLYGILVAVIDSGQLSKRLPNPSVISDRRFGIVDRNGYKVYQSDIVDNNFENMQMTKDSPIWSALKGETVKIEKRISGYDSTKRIGVYIPIKEIGWACFVTSSYESVMGKYEKEFLYDIIILLAVACLSLSFALYTGKHILQRIYILKKAANLMVDGNYSARANISGHDEISITAQAFDRMADGIEQYDKLKTQFFINLTHELKTPINVIFASVQLVSQKNTGIKADELKGRLDKHTRMVKQNCYRLLRLVNNLIDITKCDNGFLNLKLNVYNIVQVVEDITMSIVKYAEMKDIDVIFDTDIEEKYIVCDPDIIERIMLNLFSNSLKFTNEKGRILVNVYDRDEGIAITVKDTGIGIPEDKLNMIFERFRQVDDSLYRNNEGSGIGLSLVKALVESHKGTISAASVSGEGTEFAIYLPIGALGVSDNSCSDEQSKPQRMIDRINIEFSDIYSINEIQ